MKAFILNGSYADDAATEGVNERVTCELTGLGWDVDSIRLRDQQKDARHPRHDRGQDP